MYGKILKTAVVVVMLTLLLLGEVYLIHPHAPWYPHGEQFGITAYQDGARNVKGVCEASLIQGYYIAPSGSQFGGDSPSNITGLAAHQWLNGCYRGFAIASSK